jgi:hypothetical protein
VSIEQVTVLRRCRHSKVGSIGEPAGRIGLQCDLACIGIDPGTSGIYLRSSIEGECTDDPNHDGERKVTTHRYAHTVGETADLSRQLFSWEWVSTEPTYPHLHLKRSDPLFKGLGKLHIPTGRAFFEDVVRFLIQGHDVKPSRDDWDPVLKECLGQVASNATWGGRKPQWGRD